MEIEFGDKLAAALTELAAKSGTTVEHLWSVLVKQAVVGTIVSISSWIIAIVIAIFLCVIGSSDAVRSIKDDTFHKKTAFGFIGWAMVFMCVVGLFTSLSDWISALINPEYWALKQIIK